MAGLRLLPCAILVVVLLYAAYDVEAEDGCPPWNPFCPVWVPCNFTQVQGPYCHDCSTRVICTPIGGLLLKCGYPAGNCVDGECASQPSAECDYTTTTEQPTSTTEQPTTSTEQPTTPTE